MNTKELMKKVINIKEVSAVVGRKRHIIFFNGLPVLISDNALKTGINSTYLSSRDEVYLGLLEELWGTKAKVFKQ